PKPHSTVNISQRLEPRTPILPLVIENCPDYCYSDIYITGMLPLDSASPEQLADLWLPPSGSSVHWESLDVDLGIPELIAGIFGTKSWMAELGRKGGKTTSTSKSAAARQNGKKGGRPKKNISVNS
ncbi:MULTISPECIES: DUF2442 domain-containing protein, partial [unclassified Microcoleus]|uniref:DUF2442 domain-containing protein n=1 Tax=unclassified Microcoleus TaxID=2642155 RepID=UPI0025E1D2F4